MRPPPEPFSPGWRRAERRRLIAARLAMPEAARAAASRAIAASLEARLQAGSNVLIGGYWPIRGEFDALPYLRRHVGLGGRAALPVTVGRDSPLVYRPWTSETPMAGGHWDILHPAEGPEVVPAALLIPLVGFDPAGHRLGYGAGYFDRTLAHLTPKPFAIGLGFEVSRIAHLAPQPHDLPMDMIITEAGVFETRISST